MDLGTSHLSTDPIPGVNADQLLRAKEYNSRADRALQFRFKILQRSQEVATETAEREQRILRAELHEITAKTPYLDSFAPATMKSTRHSAGIAETRVHSRKRSKRDAIQRSVSLPHVNFDSETCRISHSRASVASFPVTQCDNEPIGKRESMPKISNDKDKDKLKEYSYRTRNHLRKSRYIEQALKRMYDARKKRNQPPKAKPEGPKFVNTMQRAHNMLQASFAYVSRPGSDVGNSEYNSIETDSLLPHLITTTCL